MACSPTGAAAAERGTERHDVLDGAGRTRVPGGLRLSLPAGRTSAVARLAAAEQRCCPFFDFRLQLDGAQVQFEVRAPAAGAAALTELFGPTA